VGKSSQPPISVFEALGVVRKPGTDGLKRETAEDEAILLLLRGYDEFAEAEEKEKWVGLCLHCIR
jgi:hypothetical protein